MEYLIEHRIALEVCPTSNIQLGVYASLEQHPLAQLHPMGAVVTINTDTPAVMDTTLTRELELVRDACGLPENALPQVVLNALEASFLPEEEKREQVRSVRAELEALQSPERV